MDVPEYITAQVRAEEEHFRRQGVSRVANGIADPMDFCRTCHGKGFESYPSDGALVFDTCPMCGGTGARTVVVFKAPSTKEARHG